MGETTSLGISGFQSSKPTAKAGIIVCFPSQKKYDDFYFNKKDKILRKIQNLGLESQANKVSGCFNMDLRAFTLQSLFSLKGSPHQKVRKIQGPAYAVGGMGFCKPLEGEYYAEQIECSAISQ